MDKKRQPLKVVTLATKHLDLHYLENNVGIAEVSLMLLKVAKEICGKRMDEED